MIGENFEEFGWNLGDSPRWRFIGVLAPSQIPHWWEMKWEGSLYSIKAPLPPFVIFIPSSHKYALIAYSPPCILSLILVKDLVVFEDVGHIDRTSLIFWCSIIFIFNSFCRVLFLVHLILGKIARFSQQLVSEPKVS